MKVVFVIRMCLKMVFLFPKKGGSSKEILAKETIDKLQYFIVQKHSDDLGCFF